MNNIDVTVNYFIVDIDIDIDHYFIFRLKNNQIEYMGIVIEDHDPDDSYCYTFCGSENAVVNNKQIHSWWRNCSKKITTANIKKKYPKEYKKAYKILINDAHTKKKKDFYILNLSTETLE